MSPTNHHVTSQLRHLVYYNLDCNLLSNALFLAGRLHAYEPRASEAAFLLSLCHLRLGQFRAAYDYSKNAGSRGTHLGCAYIFAQACLALEKFGEGVIALDRSKSLWTVRSNWNRHSENRRQHLPDAPAVYCLAAKLLQGNGDKQRAIEYYAEALNANPFMWDAFTGLCDLGVELRVPSSFKMTPEMVAALSQENTTADGANATASRQQEGYWDSHAEDPFGRTGDRHHPDGRGLPSSAALFEKVNARTNAIVPSVDADAVDNHNTPSYRQVGTLEKPSKAKDVAASIREDRPTADPTFAPVRKPRSAVMGAEWQSHAPPRMKSSAARSTDRTATTVDETEAINTSFSSLLGNGITERKRTISGHLASNTMASQGANTSSAAAHATADPTAPQRRSVRILNSITRPQGKPSSNSLTARDAREIKKARSLGLKGRSGPSTVGRVVSGNRKHADPMDVDGKEQREIKEARSLVSAQAIAAPTAAKPNSHDRAKAQESLVWLLDLFTKLGSGYYALSRYRCAEALQAYQSISTGQRETPWVLSQMGRALYEQQLYSEAEKYFARIKALAPARLEDAEVHSTILWHLKSEVDLSFLAHEVIELDRLSPQAWCAVGNAFALQREHDSALRCFRRATQLDPRFAYAFTLQGHEHVANEEYDRALAAFRSGIAANPRHYNAWYGLGQVYEKHGKYELAEQHYRTAAAINPTQPVLLCCVGMVLEKRNRPQPALEQYRRAAALAPRSSLARYKMARVLMTLSRPDHALAELLILKDLAPDEANVHFLLGKVYKALRRKGEAIRHFTTALNLDPKASHRIKEAMEQMEDDDLEEDEQDVDGMDHEAGDEFDDDAMIS